MAVEPRRIGPCSEGPVDVLLLKGHLRIEPQHWQDDELLAHYLDAATDFVETATARGVRGSQWEIVLDGFPDGILTLPVGPVVSLDLIDYRGQGGSTVTLDLAAVRLDLSRIEARVLPILGWPTPESDIAAVTVRWTVGATICPPKLKQAILLLAGHWFDHRSILSDGAQQELPYSVKRLIDAERRFL